MTWTDPISGHRGYVVLHNFVQGLASGGVRVRKGCTLEEVGGLALAMARKEAIVYDPSDRYVPLGGAKGGVDLDPQDPDALQVVRRFLEALRPIIREQWCTGEDLGARQEDLDLIARDIGLDSTVDAVFRRLEDADAARARLRQAFCAEVDGIGLADLTGGYGVAEAAVTYAERQRLVAKHLTAVVQGFGSIGGAAARYLQRAGVRVVGVSDRRGFIHNEDGLDIERLLQARDRTGGIDRTALRRGDDELDGERWLETDADLLVPAAVPYAISRQNQARVRAKCIIEGANLPTSPDAEEALHGRGIPVLPDFLANWATNAWWWWTVFGDVEPTAESSFGKISRTMRRLVDEVVDGAEGSGKPLRQAALALADSNARRLASRFGPPELDGRPW